MLISNWKHQRLRVRLFPERQAIRFGCKAIVFLGWSFEKNGPAILLPSCRHQIFTGSEAAVGKFLFPQLRQWSLRAMRLGALAITCQLTGRLACSAWLTGWRSASERPAPNPAGHGEECLEGVIERMSGAQVERRLSLQHPNIPSYEFGKVATDWMTNCTTEFTRMAKLVNERLFRNDRNRETARPKS